MSKASIEVKGDKGKPVTFDQLTDLITRAQLIGAPPNAEVAFDAMVEFRTPIRARRVVITWET
jgi:hypothetical protein